MQVSISSQGHIDHFFFHIYVLVQVQYCQQRRNLEIGQRSFVLKNYVMN